MAAAVCIVFPLLRDAMKANGAAVWIAVLLTAVNPVALSQALSYYSDGFLFQMLTIAAAAFAYLAYKPGGKLALAAKIAAFAAVCLAANTAINALLYCAILCLLFFLARVISITRSSASKYTRTKRNIRLFIYFISIIIAAVGVLGMASYAMNFLRYGSPLYGLYGASAVNTAFDAQMSAPFSGLPRAAQVIVSVFSRLSAEPVSDIAIKIPFTYINAEFHLATAEAVSGGWGILFSTVFIVSSLVLLWSLVLTIIRRSRRAWLIAALLLTVALPVFVLPYLFVARLYLQLYWLPLAALLCLISPAENKRNLQSGKLRGSFKWLLAAGLCAALLFSYITPCNVLTGQIQNTADARTAIETLIRETEGGDTVVDIAPAERGLYYGLLFNLQDEGLDAYNFVEHLPEDAIDGTLFASLRYRLRDAGDDASTNSFLAWLNQNGLHRRHRQTQRLRRAGCGYALAAFCSGAGRRFAQQPDGELPGCHRQWRQHPHRAKRFRGRIGANACKRNIRYAAILSVGRVYRYRRHGLRAGERRVCHCGV